MSSAISTISVSNPNSNELCLKRASIESRASIDSVCRVGSIIRSRNTGVLTLAVPASSYPKGLRPGSFISGLNYRNRSIFLFAASHEDSNSSDIEFEEDANKLKDKFGEANEAWKQIAASFKEQSFKMLNISEEAYKEYLKKAIVVLKETTEQLKIQADKASEDLVVIAKELTEEGKVYVSAAAENSPEQVKDIVETFASSTDDVKDVSHVLDFYVGIPYGGLLTLGGFISFMITGSVSGIRFGVILGGTLLALAVYSLRSWKKGESTPIALKGQLVIATLLFLRDLRLVFTRPAFTRYIALIISGAALAFYVYRLTYSRGQSTEGSSSETQDRKLGLFFRFVVMRPRLEGFGVCFFRLKSCIYLHTKTYYLIIISLRIMKNNTLIPPSASRQV
ncbi:LOW QUALITY PROTEIN: protein FATTY ACID EXPORT 3, chloroplastic-like [Rutidosis leptorrhynchoides]|uniref:LOW QUALITY PROTEIN: protein FATTY ACID EXPORT 3, chloroplastic-like n=1 Tax=Rutidosis leptorrhynchoides TaxID=125765 RepID=UPI003A98DDD1